jgi:hypothetical protein
MAGGGGILGDGGTYGLGSAGGRFKADDDGMIRESRTS